MSQKFSFYILIGSIALFLTSCSALKSTNSSTARNDRPRFIDGIEVTPGMSSTQIKHLEKEVKRNEKLEARQAKVNTENNLSTESSTALQAKYCVILDVPIETMSEDGALLREVDDWWGTPYRMGGNTKKGIDCSAFSQIVLQDIYETSIPRTAQQQYDNSVHPSSDQQLQKGDLVFFGTSKNNVTHVGVYITNNKFVHASSSKGVMISDLNEKYWEKRFVGSGRYQAYSNSTTQN
ncbi:MAG: hypothetical protein DI598_01905 [Pseudopedobacter saltans]|uniref:NlpC/P60 domain-containing protein n=1 Tax=Pseudopedobacter saltans TaxID=151895 RepID=A0A2W5F972_9SPHI|nr:MAG: hypothetical protein DI598_01905 [Pseudopedobacter saltans]